MIKRIVYTLLICSMVLGASVAQAKTLGELLPELLASHDRIKSYELAVEAAKHNKRISQAALYPTVSLSGDVTREEISKPSDGSSDSVYTRNTQTAQFDQLLYDFGSAFNSIDQSEIDVKLAETNLEFVTQGLIFEGCQAYLESLKSYRKVVTDRESVKSLNKQVALEQKQVDSGAGQIQSVLQAKQSLTQTQARQVANEGALRNSAYRYQAVFSEEMDEAGIKDFKRPPPPFQKLPTSLEQAVAEAKRGNPQLLTAKLTLDRFSKQLDGSKYGYFPTFTTYGTMKRKENDGGTAAMRVDNELGLKFNWTPYRGGATMATMKSTEASLKKSKYDLYDLNRTIEEQVRVAWQTLLTSRDVARINKDNARISGQFLELARQDKKMGGQTTLLDILLGEVAYATARSEAASAEIDTLTAAYNVLLNTGALDLSLFQ